MKFPRALIAVPIALTIGLTIGGPTAVADPPGPADPPGSKASPTGQAHRAEQAEQALAHVQALIDGRAAKKSQAHGRDFTMALHELRLLADALSPEDRAKVRRILQRPGDPGDEYVPVNLPHSSCSADVCVHYTEAGNHAPNGSDGDPATVPGYINQVRNTVQAIHDDYIAAGYRDEKGDGAIGGGNDDTDIYIGDIGDAGLYGYCTSDDPHDPFDENDPGYLDFSFWAYCTLDDDYAADEFPTNTPIENMQVTAAHEYFHATQYAYDAYEDGWILESTATWVEDEMFDSVDDNWNYFPDSPLTKPGRSIDQFGGLFHYGVWIWWRYLTEKFPAKTGKLPKLVLDVWKRLDGTPGALDEYSTQGLTKVLANRGTTLKKEFQLFSAANRHPRTVYDEGSGYPAAPAALVLGLTKQRPSKAGKGPVNHLASATVRFNPKELTKRDWKLKLSFDLPPSARGAAAVVVVYKRNGDIATSVVRIGAAGGGSKTVPFSSRTVKGVDAVLVNASARFDCWQDGSSPYSCLGIPRDDGLTYKVTGKAFR